MLEFLAAITLNRRHAGNAPGPKPSPWMAPASLLLRHPIMAALGALPLLVYGAAAVSRPAPSPPIVPQLVKTEGVRVVRLDTRTFRARWMPVYEMLPATEVRYRTQPVGGEGVVAGTVPGSAEAPQPSLSRHRLRSRPARLDVCARHGQHKVMVNRYRWRCRK
jgi:hypothetical protein